MEGTSRKRCSLSIKPRHCEKEALKSLSTQVLFCNNLLMFCFLKMESYYLLSLAEPCFVPSEGCDYRHEPLCLAEIPTYWLKWYALHWWIYKIILFKIYYQESFWKAKTICILKQKFRFCLSELHTEPAMMYPASHPHILTFSQVWFTLTPCHW